MGRKLGLAAVAAGSVAAAALVVPLMAPSTGWAPVTSGLHERPAALLPATVTVAEPVTVVSTALDADGRPVVSSHRATDRGAAERLIKAGQDAPQAVSVELDQPVYALDAPAGVDPERPNQWDLAKVRVPTAWTTSTGSGTVVAVLDSGVDVTHQDLAGQVLPGIDLVDGNSGATPGGTDPNGHGTHVAGTIAAATGNGIGVSGIAPDARILPVRVLRADGSGTMSAVATGITWAADNGANVINMSIGSSGQLAAVSNAITYARSKGVVVVASAGNSRAAGSPVTYPAADPGVIAVAATDSADQVASYSNRGSYVDIAAPGSGILSTVPNNGYAYYNGTSMAAPHVAALAALIDAARPGLTPDQVEQAITASAVDLGTKGKDTDFGYGRIDAPAALAALTKPATTTPTTAPTTRAPTAAPTTKAPTPTKSPSKTPTPTPAPVQVAIGSDLQPGLLPYGDKVKGTFSFTTSDGLPYTRKSVQLCVQEKTATRFTCSSATTSATGTIAVSRTLTAPLRLKAAVAATRTTLAADSETYAWSVQSTAVLAVGGKTSLRATLGVPSTTAVEVQRADGDSWVTVSTIRTGSGRVTLSRIAPGFTYRLSVPDTAMATGTTSNTVQM